LIMLNPLSNRAQDMVEMFTIEFRQRFIHLLGFAPFRDFPSIMAISVLDPSPSILNSSRDKVVGKIPAKLLSAEELRHFFTDIDLRRLEKYAKNLVDFHLILDIMPMLACLFLQGRCKTSMSYSQCTLFLAIGLQRKNIDQIRSELKLTSAQTLALFNKAVRKLVTWYRKLEEIDAEKQLKLEEAEAKAKEVSKPIVADLNVELATAGRSVRKKRKAKLVADMEEENEVAAHLSRTLNKNEIPSTISLPDSGTKKKKKKKRRKHSV